MSHDHDRHIGASLERGMPNLFEPDRAVDDVVPEPDHGRSDLRESVRPIVSDQDLEFGYRVRHHLLSGF